MRMVRAILASVLLISGVGVLGASTAQAQLYPEPEGVCVLTPVEPNPSIRSETEILLVLSDLNGNPIAGVASSATLLSQPGQGAKVTPLNITTDANGRATLVLATGDTAGVVKIQTVCGELSANVSIPIGQPPGPPNTGTGFDSGLASGTGIIAMGSLAAAALGLAAVAKRRASRS